MKRHLHQNQSFSLYGKWLIMTNFLLVVHYQMIISKRKSLLCDVLWIGPSTMAISPRHTLQTYPVDTPPMQSI